MNIGITTFGCDGGKSGVSQYLIRLLHEFDRLESGDSVETLLYEDEREIWLNSHQRIAAHIINPAMRSPILNVAWHQLALPRLARKRNYDLLWLPSANRRTPVTSPCPTVGTVHDFSQLHIPGKYDPARTFYQNHVLPWMIRKLTRIITISESSKADIIGHCKVPEDRVTVIPHGVDHETYYPRPAEECAERVQEKYGIASPYVLYISRIEHPGKNHVPLIRAFARAKAAESLPHRLVLVGGDWHGADEVRRAAAECGGDDVVTFTGFAPTEDLPDLYCAADLFVFPSRYEGFGMPLLEAMACGTPVACSNVSSMPEVAGNAAVLFDPENEEEIEHALQDLLTNAEARKSWSARGLERAKGFTWQESAKRSLEVFHEASER